MDDIKTIFKKIFQAQDPNIVEIIDILKKIPIFSELTWMELKKLETIIHERVYAKDEVVFQEYEPGAGMYIIKSGEIGLTKTEDGQEIKLAELQQGEFFGELSLLNDTPRTATARALRRTELLGFFRPDLLNLLQRDPKLGSRVLLKLAQVISQRLQHATERIKG